MTTPEDAADAHTAGGLENDNDNEAPEVLIARARTAALADRTRNTYDTGWSS